MRKLFAILVALVSGKTTFGLRSPPKAAALEQSGGHN